MNNKMILLAVGELSGGTLDKKGNRTSAVLEAGAELTKAKADALGLDDDAIEALVARGSLQRVSALTASDDRTVEIADMRDQLAEARRRAENAERALSLPGDDTAEGITLDEFKAFLARHDIAFAPDAAIDQLLAMEKASAEPSIGHADFGAFLTRHKIPFGVNATLDEMLAIEPASGDLFAGDPGAAMKAAADDIVKAMDLKGIKAELNKLKVPFETDANEPVLALLLAQSRAAAN